MIANSTPNHEPDNKLITTFSDFKEELKEHLIKQKSNDARNLLDNMDSIENLIHKEIKKQKGEIEPHALAFHARSNLRGFINLVGQIDGDIEGLTGWQLSRMLVPIEDQLTKILILEGGDIDD